MKILVANLGSTSFKYRLFDMADERVLARGGVERIGSPQSRCFVEAGTVSEEIDRRGPRPCRGGAALPGAAVRPAAGAVCKDPAELAAIGFKAVHAQGLTGVQRVDEQVLAAMEALRRRGPGPQSALRRGHAAAGAGAAARFRWWPPSRPAFTRRSRRPSGCTPCRWNGPTKYGIQRWGFHGASHRYIAGRTAQLLNNAEAQDHLVPPGRQQLAVCHRGREVGGQQPGHEPAERLAAQQPRRRFRPVRPAGR